MTVDAADLATALRRLEHLAESFDGPASREQIARTRRWLDLDDNRSLFAEVAADLEGTLSDGTPADRAWIAGLWHLAGRRERAAAFLEPLAADRREWAPHPHGRAGVLYLLGRYAEARAAGPETDAGRLAAIAESGGVEGMDDVRVDLVKAAVVTSGSPADTRSGDPLTDWDWVEESFELEARLTGTPVASHAEMLRRCESIVPRRQSSEPGRLSPRLGVDLSTRPGVRLQVTSSDQVLLTLGPGRLLELRRREGARWGVVETTSKDDSGNWIVDLAWGTWQEAADAAADWLDVNRGGDSGADIRDLVARYAATATDVPFDPGTHWEPPPRDIVALDDAPDATLEVDIGRVEATIDPETYVELRWSEEGWSATAAPSPYDLSEEVASRAGSWREAAERAAQWLDAHRGDRAGATLRALVARAPDLE